MDTQALEQEIDLEHGIVFIIPTLAIAPVSSSIFTFRWIVYPRN
ncbi:MAG: hypothetical protein RM021_019770 [Nostoc sp. EkiNYC01]